MTRSEETGRTASGVTSGNVRDSDSMTSNWKALTDTAVPRILPILPYPDLRRHRRIRRESRKLVDQSSWPNNDAKPIDVARLALRRLLYLQREAHRAVRWRHREAAALLARSSIEGCITGLYCLYSEDPVERLRRDTGKSLGQILRPISDQNFLTPDAIQAMTELITGSISDGNHPPDLHQMSITAANASGEPAATILYNQLYRPLSTLFAHSRGLALLRHVGWDGKLKDRPDSPWVRRSAARTADACVGVLAAAVAEHQGTQNVAFSKYANDHWRRVVHPITTIGWMGILHSVKWTRIPGAWKPIKDFRRYYWSEQAKHDPTEVVETRLREAYQMALQAIGPDAPQSELRLVIDNLVAQLASTISPTGDETGSANDSDT